MTPLPRKWHRLLASELLIRDVNFGLFLREGGNSSDTFRLISRMSVHSPETFFGSRARCGIGFQRLPACQDGAPNHRLARSLCHVTRYGKCVNARQLAPRAVSQFPMLWCSPLPVLGEKGSGVRGRSWIGSRIMESREQCHLETVSSRSLLIALNRNSNEYQLCRQFRSRQRCTRGITG